MPKTQELTLKEYQRMAGRTIPKENTELNEQQEKGIRLAVELMTEVGEILDLLKKNAYHGRRLNLQKLADEIGDAHWGLYAVATNFNIDMEAVARTTDNKLKFRYPDEFFERGNNSAS